MSGESNISNALRNIQKQTALTATPDAITKNQIATDKYALSLSTLNSKNTNSEFVKKQKE